MNVTQKIKMDLLTKQNIQTIHAVRDDTNSRYVEISLFEGGIPWAVPENSHIAIAYLAANGANGIYDTLPSGADAYIYDENKISVILVPAALYPGITKITVAISDENGNQISTFPLNVEVDENYLYGASKPETYINLRQWMTAELANLVWDYAVNVYPDQAGDGYVSERPYDAILREYESGRAVYCALEISDQERLQLPFVKIDGGVLYFSAVCAGKEYLVTISADGVTVEISECGGGNSGGNAELDTTLTQSGKAADAKAVGDILATLTLGQHTDGLVYIFIGGQPVGNGLSITGGEVVEPVYGQPVTDKAILSIAKGQTVQLGVMLSEEPTQEQTITILTECAALSFDKTILTFTPDDWNVFQFISVTAGDVDEDTAATIILQNSDKLLTDTNIMVYLSADGYAVDTTIPTEGQHVVTLDDFEKTQAFGNYIRLYGYKGEYENIVIPSELDGKIPWVTCTSMSPTIATTTFSYGNTTIKYVTLGDGVIYRSAGDTASASDATGLFLNCTNLIGVSNMNPVCTNLHEAFKGCTNLKFVDNIGELVNVIRMESAFELSGIEYIPDLSKMTAVTTMVKCFYGCVSLKRVYGMPNPSATCNMAQMFYGGCAALEKAEIPENVSNISYAFGNCTALRNIDIKATEITNVTNAFLNCSDLTVRVVKDSTTYNTVVNAYGNTSAVTITFLGSDEGVPVIAVWGDSTSSPNRTWREWPARLQEAVTAYVVKNQAVSGEYTTSASARQGGNALSVGAFTIPADTSLVEITLTSADGQTFGAGGPVFNPGGSFNPCTIAGVRGTIVNAGSGVYKFARKTAGDSVEVPAGTIVTSDADGTFNNADAVMLVNIGINAGWNTNADTLLNQVQMMVNHFTESGGTKYIITGPYAGQFLTTESSREAVFSYETKAATAFGEHWLNLREYLIANGLTENGLTASELDNQRMAVGLIPASLLGGGSTTDIPMYDGKNVTDQTHPNSYGQNSIFNAFYAKGKALGYWT